MLVGVLGALVAGLPLALTIEALGWRPIMAAVALLSLVLAPAGLVGPALAFTGLWGVPFLVSHYGMREATAALYCSGLLVVWALAGPLLGALSDRLGHRKPLHLICSACGLLGWALVVLSPPGSRALLLIALMLAGFGAGIVGVSFAYAKESVPGRYAGTIGGLVNMGVMLGPMLLQPAIGWVLDRNWSGLMVAGARVYELDAYRSGFGLMLGWTALAFLLVSLTHESHCQSA